MTLELHRSSFLELGNLLLSLYAKFTSHSSEVKSLTAPLHIELNVEADVEIELREAEEKALNLPSDDNDAAMDSPDVIVIPEDPQTEIKKKRKAVVQEASRSSKRVRAKTVEEETQNVSTDLDIKEQLDPWLPSGWKLSLEDSSARNASMLVPDLSDYFEQIYAKLSTNDSTLTRKGRSKK